MTELQQQVFEHLKTLKRRVFTGAHIGSGLTSQGFAVVFWSLVRGGHVVLVGCNPLQWRLRFDGCVVLPLVCAKCNNVHFCVGNTCDGCKENT